MIEKYVVRTEFFIKVDGIIMRSIPIISTSEVPDEAMSKHLTELPGRSIEFFRAAMDNIEFLTEFEPVEDDTDGR